MTLLVEDTKDDNKTAWKEVTLDNKNNLEENYNEGDMCLSSMLYVARDQDNFFLFCRKKSRNIKSHDSMKHHNQIWNKGREIVEWKETDLIGYFFYECNRK